MLGTDRDELYRLDDVILRRVVSRHDEQPLSQLTRHEAEPGRARAGDRARRDRSRHRRSRRFVPLRIVTDYLGVHFYRGAASRGAARVAGGDTFPLDDDLQKVFTFSRIQEGLVPTAEDLFRWVKDAFRNTFNNFNAGASAVRSSFASAGSVATELPDRVHPRVAGGLQGAAAAGRRRARHDADATAAPAAAGDGDGGAALEQEFAAMLGSPSCRRESSRGASSDSMIRSNVFGTVVGAVVNPQEATARIVDSHAAPEGWREPGAQRCNSSYDTRPDWPASTRDEPDYAPEPAAAAQIRARGAATAAAGRSAVAALRAGQRELGGVPSRGTPVFVGYAAAMRDPQAVPRHWRSISDA